ncbi:hypothetical protein Ddc_15965 [Ditylenchus destructor]|nr:hypothetical protein Ddc_15965 [Ditylenchus destructor]
MTQPLKFFKVDDSTIYHDGFSYSFHHDLDSAESSADLQLHHSFRCALGEEKQNCRSRIHVTGNWEVDKKGRKFMLGIVKKGEHNHEPDYRDTTPKLRFYKNDDESIHRNGFNYSFYRELDPPKQAADFQWHETYRCSTSVIGQENCRVRIYTTGQWEVNKRDLQYQLGIFKNSIHNHESEQDSNKEDNFVATVSPLTHTKDLDKMEQIRFYKYKETCVQYDGFVYSHHKYVKSHSQWRSRMTCNRQINGKQNCTAYIWTTGKWEADDRGREFQIGIVLAQHDHDPYQIAFQGQDNDDESPEAGLKFYKYIDKKVHRDGHTYFFVANLKSRPPWKQRMRCTRRNDVTKNSNCKGYIWTTGEWETDNRGRLYQRGIPRGGHSHDAYEHFFDEDNTAFVGNVPIDNKNSFIEGMTQPLKFFKIDDSTIYHDGFSYSFHHDLDPAKSSAELQLHHSFRCTFGEEKQNCRSGIHVTGNWEVDKKGRKFMLGIVKKGEHNHEPEYRDTTPKLRFYKNDDESIHRNGFNYSFYRELDPPKQAADFQWHETYRCSTSVIGQENCRARIYTTGQWERNKRDLQYQLGIFKNSIHNHESEQDSKRVEDDRVEAMATCSSFTSHIDNNAAEQDTRLYKYKDTTIQHNGFVYSFHSKIRGHPKWKQRMFCQRLLKGKKTCKGFIRTTGKWESDERGREYQIGIVMAQHDHEPLQIAIQGKDNDDESLKPGLKFFCMENKLKRKMVYRDGFAYVLDNKLKCQTPWEQRMKCNRTWTKFPCRGSIWTTGTWETDGLGRAYQRGIHRRGHSHKPYQQFLNEDDTTNVGISELMEDVN